MRIKYKRMRLGVHFVAFLKSTSSIKNIFKEKLGVYQNSKSIFKRLKN